MEVGMLDRSEMGDVNIVVSYSVITGRQEPKLEVCEAWSNSYEPANPWSRISKLTPICLKWEWRLLSGVTECKTRDLPLSTAPSTKQ